MTGFCIWSLISWVRSFKVTLQKTNHKRRNTWSNLLQSLVQCSASLCLEPWYFSSPLLQGWSQTPGNKHMLCDKVWFRSIFNFSALAGTKKKKSWFGKRTVVTEILNPPEYSLWSGTLLHSWGLLPLLAVSATWKHKKHLLGCEITGEFVNHASAHFQFQYIWQCISKHAVQNCCW